MNSSFQNPTIVGVATQTEAATAGNHLVRLSEVMTLVAAVNGGVSGIVNVPSGQRTNSVTFASLGYTPTKCFLTVAAPNDPNRMGLSIQVVGALTATGFTWEFTNGTPDISGYSFHYLLLP